MALSTLLSNGNGYIANKYYHIIIIMSIKVGEKMEKEKIEFSKIIMSVSMVESWMALLLAVFLTIKYGLDSMLGTTILTVSWASYTSGKVLYYTKAKAENIYKLRLEFLKFKMNSTNSSGDIDDELREIDNAFKMQFDNLENEKIE